MATATPLLPATSAFVVDEAFVFNTAAFNSSAQYIPKTVFVSSTPGVACDCTMCKFAAIAPPTAPVLNPLSFDLFPTRVEIDVTAQDIALGTRRNTSDCAIARAVRRRFDGADCVVGGGYVRMVVDGFIAAYEPVEPAAVCFFISAFDNGFAPKPTRFAFRRVA